MESEKELLYQDLKVVDKRFGEFRLWITTMRLPKASANQKFLGRDFDEWLKLDWGKFLILLDQNDPHFEFVKLFDKENKRELIYAQINNVRVLIGYIDSKLEFGIPVKWFNTHDGEWDIQMKENTKRLTEARNEFNKNKK